MSTTSYDQVMVLSSKDCPRPNLSQLELGIQIIKYLAPQSLCYPLHLQSACGKWEATYVWREKKKRKTLGERAIRVNKGPVA